MLISSLLFIPIIGVLLLYTRTYLAHYDLELHENAPVRRSRQNVVLNNRGRQATDEENPGSNKFNFGCAENDFVATDEFVRFDPYNKDRKIALGISILNLIISFVVYIIYDSSCIIFQFLEDNYVSATSFFNIYLGVDGISIYFVLLTTTIMPLAILSNWRSITSNVRSYLIILLLLETLLISVFLVLDALLFYIFFESILVPLFLLLGLFGSVNKVRASYYLFLYTLGSSLFMLLSILSIGSTTGSTDFWVLNKINLDFSLQVFLFIGIIIAFAVKTPLYGLNSWLLKAHVEAPLGGSIVLAAIVLKLALYGVFRLLLPILPKACIYFSPLIFIICAITVILSAFSTLRTTDVKEIIAYSSVGHAAVYLMGAFSNTVAGIEGSILLGLAHAYASSGLFIVVGGILYDRTGTRVISFYRGLGQLMPLLSILFFILTLANCGTPLTLNFAGEFLSLYGAFTRLPILAALACSSIVFSAAYSIYLFNRLIFGGSFSLYFIESVKDLTKREFFILLILVSFTVLLGIYPSFILDGLDYNVSSLIYSVDLSNMEASSIW